MCLPAIRFVPAICWPAVNILYAFRKHPEFNTDYSAALIDFHRDVISAEHIEHGEDIADKSTGRDQLFARWAVNFILLIHKLLLTLFLIRDYILDLSKKHKLYFNNLGLQGLFDGSYNDWIKWRCARTEFRDEFAVATDQIFVEVPFRIDT